LKNDIFVRPGGVSSGRGDGEKEVQTRRNAVPKPTGKEGSPELPSNKPGAKEPAATPKFEFTDAERKGKVSKERFQQWAKDVGVKDASWEKQGRNFMNDALKKTMKNAPAASEAQKETEKKVKEYRGVSESLLAAFNKLHEKNSANIFAEAKKMKIADEEYDLNFEEVEELDELTGYRKKKWFGKDPLLAVAKRANDRIKVMPKNKKELATNIKYNKVAKNAFYRMEEEFEELDEANLMHIEVGEKVRLSNPKAPARHVVTKIKGQNVHIKRHPDDKEIVMPLNRVKKVKAQAAELTGKMKEEFEDLFSEQELENIIAILEAQPVSPTPDDYSGIKDGPSVRDLTDEVVAEGLGKGSGRGRPKGSKSGSKYGVGGEGASTPHMVDQIRYAEQRKIADGKGNYMLQHPVTNEKKAVPQKEANSFYQRYMNADKASEKNGHLSDFLGKHFGDSRAAPAPAIHKMDPKERAKALYPGVRGK
jgi:hypothetical protein